MYCYCRRINPNILRKTRGDVSPLHHLNMKTLQIKKPESKSSSGPPSIIHSEGRMSHARVNLPNAKTSQTIHRDNRWSPRYDCGHNEFDDREIYQQEDWMLPTPGLRSYGRMDECCDVSQHSRLTSSKNSFLINSGLSSGETTLASDFTPSPQFDVTKRRNDAKYEKYDIKSKISYDYMYSPNPRK